MVAKCQYCPRWRKTGWGWGLTLIYALISGCGFNDTILIAEVVCILICCISLYRTTSTGNSCYSSRYVHQIQLCYALHITTVCPPVSNNTLGTCNEACSSDGDCSNGQLCCSNGCGHVCMSPDPCAVSVIVMMM